MTLEHVAIWTDNLELLKAYYLKYFQANSNHKYTNPIKGFESYFLSFESGARLEIMSMPGIPANSNDTIKAQHRGIIHLAFGVNSGGGSRCKGNGIKRKRLFYFKRPKKNR
jgi:lactoylglutathione lyase